MELANLKSQIVISSWGGARRAPPYAFAEQGVAMLSSVLRSKRAVLVNIEIIRTFVRLRRILADDVDLLRKLNTRPRRCMAEDGQPCGGRTLQQKPDGLGPIGPAIETVQHPVSHRYVRKGQRQRVRNHLHHRQGLLDRIKQAAQEYQREGIDRGDEIGL